jgi:nuclear pore complex protein Nup107
MSESLYSSCAEVLSVCQAAKDDLAALLDPNTGFAPRLRQLCRDQCVSNILSVERASPVTRITEAENSASSDVSQEELDVLRMEANTWGLLQAVMP